MIPTSKYLNPYTKMLQYKDFTHGNVGRYPHNKSFDIYIERYNIIGVISTAPSAAKVQCHDTDMLAV